MKSYVAVTGAIFAILTFVHALRIIVEWPHASKDPGFLWSMSGLTLVTGVLAVWAWRVLRIRN